jgi:hypothetical protein
LVHNEFVTAIQYRFGLTWTDVVTLCVDDSSAQPPAPRDVGERSYLFSIRVRLWRDDAFASPPFDDQPAAHRSTSKRKSEDRDAGAANARIDAVMRNMMIDVDDDERRWMYEYDAAELRYDVRIPEQPCQLRTSRVNSYTGPASTPRCSHDDVAPQSSGVIDYELRETLSALAMERGAEIEFDAQHTDVRKEVG